MEFLEKAVDDLFNIHTGVFVTLPPLTLLIDHFNTGVAALTGLVGLTYGVLRVYKTYQEIKHKNTDE